MLFRLRNDRTDGFQVFLERDRMMRMDVDDEQGVGAGWRYGRRSNRDAQLRFAQ